MTLLPAALIARKRDGAELGRPEIAAFVRGAVDGSWADYQLSALLMAIFIRGLTPAETAVLTEEMMRSGAVADWAALPAPRVDKHSTGGVGDKVSIHLAPMVAACGVAVPMIAGRGLGHTGGTVDKIESIPGLRTDLTVAEFQEQVARIGVCLAGQGPELAPADRKLYALRDVTGTVESIPLICASILSKKLAEGLDALVLDVKFGRGAFMQDLAKARELAESLVGTAHALGRPARAVLTSMDEPLGRAVGNAVEVAESIACLGGRGPADLMEVTFALGAEMLLLGGVARDDAHARERLRAVLDSGAALGKFRELVRAQGGDARVADDPSVLPRAPIREPLASPADGWIRDVDARGVAEAALRLGTGRARASDSVQPAAGLDGLAKVGERVARGQPLAYIHAMDTESLRGARDLLGRAIAVGPEPVRPAGRIAGVIGRPLTRMGTPLRDPELG